MISNREGECPLYCLAEKVGFALRCGAGLGFGSEAALRLHSLPNPFKSYIFGNNFKGRVVTLPLKLAEKVGFEPTHRLSQSTPLAGEPLIATWVFLHMAEMVGFEPTGTCMPTVFKTASLDHSDTSPCFRCSPLPSEGKYTKRHLNCQWVSLSIRPRRSRVCSTPALPARSPPAPASRFGKVPPPLRRRPAGA